MEKAYHAFITMSTVFKSHDLTLEMKLKLRTDYIFTNVKDLQRMNKTTELFNTVKCKNPQRYELLLVQHCYTVRGEESPACLARVPYQLFRIAVYYLIAMKVAHIRKG